MKSENCRAREHPRGDGRNLLARLVEGKSVAIERLVGALDGRNAFARKPTPLQPSLLMPWGEAGLPDTVTKGGRSCSSTVPTPQKLWAPTRTN
jgi:hypothetical protein